MFLPLKIAIRFLKSSKGQTILITLGIAIGVSVQIFIGLLIQGLQTSLIDKTIGNASHITISSATTEKTFDGYFDIIKDIENRKEIKGVSASLDRPSFTNVNDEAQTIIVRGLTLDGADKIYRIKDALIEGQMPFATNKVIVGKSFFESAGYVVGDSIDIFVPELGVKTLEIGGVFDLKVSNINNTWFITSLATAQSVFELEDVVSSIEIQVNDVFASTVIAEEISKNIDSDKLKIADWQVQNEELLSGLSGQSVSSIMIQIFVIISVVLGIASVLAISVLQKSKQIGILKAMGIKDGATSLIFLTQGFILGVLGAITGILLGLGLSIAFTKFALNPDGTPLIPLTINIGFVILSAGIAIVASMGASLIPSIKSLKMDPIEVIKNG